MRLREEFDFSIEQALTYFEKDTNIVIYPENTFGFANPIQTMLRNIYKSDVIVTPEFIIFDHQYCYYTPSWMQDFVYDAIKRNHDYHLTTGWCINKLEELIELQESA